MTGKSDTGGAEEARGAEAQDAVPADKDEAAKSARPRRIVRSRSTAVTAGEGEAAKPEGEAALPAPGAGAAEAPQAAEAAAKEYAPRTPRHDLRAPGPARRRPSSL